MTNIDPHARRLLLHLFLEGAMSARVVRGRTVTA